MFHLFIQWLLTEQISQNFFISIKVELYFDIHILSTHLTFQGKVIRKQQEIYTTVL